MTARRAIVLLTPVVLGLILLWTFGSLMARAYNHSVPPPAAPGRIVQLTSRDGTPIAASFWPGRDADAPAVLLLHGIGGSRDNWARHAAWLNVLGYAVLAPDFRGHGGSGAAERTFGWREADDAAAGFDFLRRDAPGRRIGVIGVSLGGAAALLGRGGPLPADAMVLQAVYPDLRTAIRNRIGSRAGGMLATGAEPLLSFQSWLRYGVGPGRIAPVDGLKRFGGRVLIIGGGADAQTTPADTRRLYSSAAGPEALWMVAGADHADTCGLWSPTYRARVGAFLDGTLRPLSVSSHMSGGAPMRSGSPLVPRPAPTTSVRPPSRTTPHA